TRALVAAKRDREKFARGDAGQSVTQPTQKDKGFAIAQGSHRAVHEHVLNAGDRTRGNTGFGEAQREPVRVRGVLEKQSAGAAAGHAETEIGSHLGAASRTNRILDDDGRIRDGICERGGGTTQHDRACDQRKQPIHKTPLQDLPKTNRTTRTAAEPHKRLTRWGIWRVASIYLPK